MLPAACDHGQFLDRVLHALRLVYKSVLAEQPYGPKQRKVCKLWLCTDHGRPTGASLAAYKCFLPWPELAAIKTLESNAARA